MVKQKKISKKEGYKKAKEIIKVLEDEDKEALRETTYVCYDDIIEFPKPCTFTLKRLKKIIREAEKYKKADGKGMLIGVELRISTKNMTTEMKQIMKKNNGINMCSSVEGGKTNETRKIN